MSKGEKQQHQSKDVTTQQQQPNSYHMMAVGYADDRKRAAHMAPPPRRDVPSAAVKQRVTTAAIASLIGTIVAWAIVVHVMRAEWTFIPEAVFWTLGLSLFLTVASGFVGTWLALGQKPAKHLCNE